LLRIDAQLGVYLTAMRVSVILLLGAILFLTVAINYLLLRPIALHEKSIRKGEPLTPSGARELRYLTTTYNTMYEKNYIQTQNLQHEAKTDALTGVLNRAHYDRMLEMHRHDSALILVDIDNFKSFNDDYGHEMGDAVLVEVAATLFGTFRQSDFICRIGGDEFAIIMTQMKPEFREVIERKLEKVTAFLRDTSNGLPPVTLSVGIAFGDESSTPESIFEAADSALYKVKDAGRNGYRFAE
jgi:diguanylate cyclase (GGDEF)-like protein